MIHLTPAALRELKRLQMKQPNIPPIIRLSLQSGGCGEWTYCLGLDNPRLSAPSTDDIFQDHGEFRIVISATDRPRLEELTIDYTEDLMGGGFRFINPQAVQTCGCGNAFSLTLSSEPGTECLTSNREELSPEQE
ncbi:hypothetical protein XM38_009100 [Halomicronema hongdechloris C2206]|uniref:Core domain-containing protein n=1 Tax=Halomicronema hongdechloris C2206 TaxID=1641165 RepID=A0A1Z3HI73_9CYAN|nr:iron-sulfur cluster assembly accessory protein [Halomicronema hongdechloris]ASC69980.1 hypothetical protein XM38_009100 [Halomicronema hongdechloris C2206]